MKNFKEFLIEASINANGELTDFNFDDEEGNHDPFHEEVDGNGGDGVFDDDQNKNNLLVYVTDVLNNRDFNEFADPEDSHICISFYRTADHSMVDNHMLDLFPEIGNNQQYDDGGEGVLMYYGNRTIPQLRAYLRRLGFTVSEEEDDFGVAERNGGQKYETLKIV